MVTVLALTACATGPSTPKVSASAGDGGLVQAAKAEGALVFYSNEDPTYNQNLADAFQKKYGIHATFYRGTSADVMNKFSAEMAAGSPQADAVMLIDPTYLTNYSGHDWWVKTTEKNIPGVDAYPAQGRKDSSVAVSIQIAGVAYNTQLVKSPPTKWEQLTGSKYQGHTLLADPRAALGNNAQFDLLRKQYGDDFLSGIAAQNPTFFTGSVPATQALGAGEGWVLYPVSETYVASAEQQGAPLAMAKLPLTFGPLPEIAAVRKAQHPNAAKLFLSWLISPAGQAVVTSQPGRYSVTDPPKGFKTLDIVGGQGNKDLILKLLKLQG